MPAGIDRSRWSSSSRRRASRALDCDVGASTAVFALLWLAIVAAVGLLASSGLLEMDGHDRLAEPLRHAGSQIVTFFFREIVVPGWAERFGRPLGPLFTVAWQLGLPIAVGLLFTLAREAWRGRSRRAPLDGWAGAASGSDE